MKATTRRRTGNSRDPTPSTRHITCASLPTDSTPPTPRRPPPGPPPRGGIPPPAPSGLTNRGVAERAFVSAKTVEANLARVYDKLGVHSRAELGRVMAEREQTVNT